MSENVVRLVTATEQSQSGVVAALEGVLAAACAGRIRSAIVLTLDADGDMAMHAVGHVSEAEIVGQLTYATHDVMAARHE